MTTQQTTDETFYSDDDLLMMTDEGINRTITGIHGELRKSKTPLGGLRTVAEDAACIQLAELSAERRYRREQDRLGLAR